MCWKCGNNIEVEFVSRSSECSFCHASLHSCKNCMYFSPGSHYDCHESVDELVADKEKANFCDYFKARKSFSGVSNANKKAEDAKKLLSSLFS